MNVKRIIAILLVLGAGYLLATPYLVVNEMRTAARERDAVALAAHIDFESVRQSFKDQLNTAVRPRSNDNVLATMGAMVAGAVAERLIDFMVTPEGLRQLMSGVAPAADSAAGKPAREPFEKVSRRYEALDRFVASVDTDEGKRIDFVLRRRGLQWQLAEIRLPQRAEQ